MKPTFTLIVLFLVVLPESFGQQISPEQVALDFFIKEISNNEDNKNLKFLVDPIIENWNPVLHFPHCNEFKDYGETIYLM